jgi:CPA2 family monovalent cation:H+ antiporter-2
MDSLFLGAILSISSTTIIVKALEELGLTKSKFSDLIFGILIFEDILGILIIAVLCGIAQTGSFQLGQSLGAAAKLLSFLVVSLVLGLLCVPKLLHYVARFKRPEMLLVTVLALCFAGCVVTLKLGYSVALGAFLMGAIVAVAREIGQIEGLMEPIRDMFSAVFFVSIGLLIEPKMLADYAWPIMIITLAVVFGKIFACSFGAFAAGQDLQTSLRVGMGLAQIGEFSFIIAALGINLGVTSNFLYPIAVTVSSITTLVTPYLIRSTGPVVNWFGKTAPVRLTNSLQLYTAWINHSAAPNRVTMARKLMRRWLVVIFINLFFITGIFLGTGVLGKLKTEWLTMRGFTENTIHSLLWLGAMVVSLPFLIATYKKLQALGMLIAEIRVKRELSNERRLIIENVVSNTIVIVGLIAIALLMLILSSSILQSGKSLWLLLLIVGALTTLLWRTFTRVYAKAQFAVQEAFVRPPLEDHGRTHLPAILQEAKMETIAISDSMQATHKLISELQLRSRTGASIVAIQRQGISLVNPEPHEELLPGDEILLIGRAEQLTAAQNYLSSGKEAGM